MIEAIVESIIIRGGKPLTGEIQISGAKNACLTLMPAALMSGEKLTLHNVPDLADIETMSALLSSLGAIVEREDDGAITIDSRRINNLRADYDIVRKMRASSLVLGPLLAREGRAELSQPGGCAIGARPIDLHLQGLEELGARFELAGGYIMASAPNGINGGHFRFPFISVGATENMIMAACFAKGTVRLENCAREPEIGDLISCLRSMGAAIENLGDGTIEIEGGKTLTAATHTALADRIELASYAIASAITGGDLLLKGGHEDLIEEPISTLRQAGVVIEDQTTGLRAYRNGSLKAISVTTEAYPGFPTDLQAQLMSLLSLAEGCSHIHETIFENRFMHVPELQRMGANISLDGPHARIEGVDRLVAAPVMATDLRASMSLILAALAAKGSTKVSRVYHLDRGYEKVEEKLQACGAEIERIK